MIRYCAVAILVLASACELRAGGPEVSGPDAAAVKQVLFDYASSYFEGDAGKMEKTLHPSILNRGVVYSRTSGSTALITATAEAMLAGARDGRIRMDEDKRNVAVEVLDIQGPMASARVSSALWYDYVTLMNDDGHWVIVNSLWCPPSATDGIDFAAEETAIWETVGRMFDAFAKGEAERAAAGLHADCALRALRPSSNGAYTLENHSADTYLTAARSGSVPVISQNPAAVKVLDLYRDIALAKVDCAYTCQFLQLVRRDGQWKIVNALAILKSPHATTAAK